MVGFEEFYRSDKVYIRSNKRLAQHHVLIKGQSGRNELRLDTKSTFKGGGGDPQSDPNWKRLSFFLFFYIIIILFGFNCILAIEYLVATWSIFSVNFSMKPGLSTLGGTIPWST